MKHVSCTRLVDPTRLMCQAVRSLLTGQSPSAIPHVIPSEIFAISQDFAPNIEITTSFFCSAVVAHFVRDIMRQRSEVPSRDRFPHTAATGVSIISCCANLPPIAAFFKALCGSAVSCQRVLVVSKTNADRDPLTILNYLSSRIM
jgi:hypothetical protein